MNKFKIFGLLGLIILIIFLYQQNNQLEITKSTLKFSHLSAEFDGVKIIHLSDLHNKSFGRHQKRLIAKLTQLNPDLIAITGDLVDELGYNPQAALTLLEKANQLASVYLVTGNNDLGVNKWSRLKEKIRQTGTTILNNQTTTIVCGRQKIKLVGIEDPGGGFRPQPEIRHILNQKLATVCLKNQQQSFSILLVHRPQFLELYQRYQFDLVLAGHVHGGQIRLPGLGGLVGPGQGLFPKYTKGVYSLEETKLVVNRGLGNSILPQRIFNRPEIGVIKLQQCNRKYSGLNQEGRGDNNESEPKI